MRLLIIGGYGAFGGRLIETLSRHPSLEFLVAGRSMKKAQAFCRNFDYGARTTPVQLDRANIATALTDHTPDIVVDASGPFQSYGEPYAVPRACIAAGVHYLDLADGSAFVNNITELHAQAKEAGVCVISGLSTCPAITCAVLDEIDMRIEIHDASGGIAPSPRADLGKSVVRAILGYCGGVVPTYEGDPNAPRIGLTERRLEAIAPPNAFPLQPRDFALVDLPELQLLPRRYPSIDNVWFGAGIAPRVLMAIVTSLAHVRKALRLPALTFLTPLGIRALNWMNWGKHRGGMFLEVQGQDRATGQDTTARWDFIGEGDDGPYVPVLSIAALISKWLDGDVPATGARPAAGELTLADLQVEFDRLQITHGFRYDIEAQTTLLDKAVGPEIANTLPAAVRALHHRSNQQSWIGKATVTGDKTPWAWAVRKVISFPTPGDNTPLRFHREVQNGEEGWTRTFNGKTLFSKLVQGTGRDKGLVVEVFSGTIQIGTAFIVDGDKLRIVPRAWSFLGLPMPNFLIPNCDIYSTEHDGNYAFHVEVHAPLLGHIVTYVGELEPE